MGGGGGGERLMKLLRREVMEERFKNYMTVKIVKESRKCENI